MSTGNQSSPVVLITGAARGIGPAILTRLASDPRTQHLTFILGCRSQKAGQEPIASLSQPPHSIPQATIDRMIIVELDLAQDKSIHRAVAEINSNYERLDVLINNSGIASIPKEDISDFRDSFQQVFNINVTAVALLTSLLLPLLRASARVNPTSGGRVINILSARGSTSRAAAGSLPPSVSVAYDTSKAALNRLTVGMAMAPENREAGVEFQLVSPGHCKTAFNGFRGARDPLEGVTAVVEILGREKGWAGDGVGMWETVGNGTELVQSAW